MTIFHDEIEIEDFEYDEDDEVYYYPCPCGDRFEITKVCGHSATERFMLSELESDRILLPHFCPQEDLEAGEEEATCPTCSLVVRVIYDPVSRHISSNREIFNVGRIQLPS